MSQHERQPFPILQGVIALIFVVTCLIIAMHDPLYLDKFPALSAENYPYKI